MGLYSKIGQTTIILTNKLLNTGQPGQILQGQVCVEKSGIKIGVENAEML